MSTQKYSVIYIHKLENNSTTCYSLCTYLFKCWIFKMDKVFTNGRMYVCIFIADVQNDHTVLLFAIFLSSFGEIVAEKFELNTYTLSSFPGLPFVFWFLVPVVCVRWIFPEIYFSTNKLLVLCVCTRGHHVIPLKFSQEWRIKFSARNIE